jgi:acyl dehydratase
MSDWLTVDQAMIDAFADATRDHQWVHVDTERAGREMGGTIAHGFLTLSLCTTLASEALTVSHSARGLNYGFDKLRFTGMVRSGSRIRLALTLAAVEQRSDGGLLVKRHCSIECEGTERPVMVADWLAVTYPQAAV